ncbi:MAG: SPOR domain-containing protein [Rickettsiales bacterium]|jgi:cell division septation protein DedD|nr:SPOR domain-containing protein [Rickettsiales bacterium]
MNNENDSLDLLDLDTDETLDVLPESSPLTAPRARKPWLLMVVGLLVIVLATYIIVRTIGSDNSSFVEINLDTPEAVKLGETDGQAAEPLIIPPLQSAPPQKAEPSHATPGVPVREITDRKEVRFNPDKPSAKTNNTIAKPKPTVKSKPAAASGGWYVQFGSYSTRHLAEVAQKKIKSRHSSLFEGKQFVILAAVLPNGTTTYRLRVAFSNSSEANGFCRNAKSDGLDCYVAR